MEESLDQVRGCVQKCSPGSSSKGKRFLLPSYVLQLLLGDLRTSSDQKRYISFQRVPGLLNVGRVKKNIFRQVFRSD
ncbi:hypothetical protein CRENBAI_011443 [Crenichthys baileyi]|uniref:Uncharacterized protein n=1 Tax=Crenichthys baileyi TaxID=28760 RepID=A0AAV9SKR2_9TELE